MTSNSAPADNRYHLQGVVLPQGQSRDIWIADGQISYAEVAGAKTIATDCWLLPGLADAHCHIGIGPKGSVPEEVTLAQAQADLAAGVMLIRDAGSPSDTRWVQQRADLPKLIRSGRHIARPMRYLRFLGAEVEPEALVAQVKHEAQSGDGWVKLVGDWIDRATGELDPLWPVDVAAQAIEAAHELGARVTAHCFGEQALTELVAAGIDCIEHGTGGNLEVFAEMAERGTALVPTMINLARFPQYAEPGREKYPRFADYMMALYEVRLETIAKAYQAGVQIYAGTDAGTVVPHGQILAEIDALAEIGGNEFALGAASWRSRSWLGAENLTEGASADLLVLAEDPRLKLATLQTPLAKLLRGQLV